MARRVARRLRLLLLVPTAAVLLVGAPPVIDRLDQAHDADLVVTTVADARAAGLLVEHLQAERLLALAALLSPAATRPALTREFESTVDDTVRARAALVRPAGADLRTALAKLDDLAATHDAVLAGTAIAADVHATYTGAVQNLIDALHLPAQPATDATWSRRLLAVDALLRAGEQSSRAGAALVVAAAEPGTATTLARAVDAGPYATQFRQLGEPAQVSTMDSDAAGSSARRSAELLADLADGRSVSVTVDEGMALARGDADLRGRLFARVLGDDAAAAATGQSEARLAVVRASGVTAGSLLVIVLIGGTVIGSVTRPLRRLSAAAGALADEAEREAVRVSEAGAADEPPQLTALTQRSRDEIGQVASAVNRLRATAVLLMRHQVEARRHTLDTVRLTGPRTLTEVVRTAIAEVGGDRPVRLGRIDQLMLPALVVPDLTLILAELLSNATAASPPDIPVEVSAVRVGDCVIHIVDHRPGVTAAQLEHENARLSTVDVTTVDTTDAATAHGLVVVGRLARRHGLMVQLFPTPGGGITAEVAIPPSQLLVGAEPAPVGPTLALPAAPSRPPTPSAPAPSAPAPSAPVPSAPLPAAPVPVASVPAAPVPVASVPVASVPSASVPSAPTPGAPLPGASVPGASVPSAAVPSAVPATPAVPAVPGVLAPVRPGSVGLSAEPPPVSSGPDHPWFGPPERLPDPPQQVVTTVSDAAEPTPSTDHGGPVRPPLHPGGITPRAADVVPPTDVPPRPADILPRPAAALRPATDVPRQTTAPRPADAAPRPAADAPRPTDVAPRPADAAPRPADAAPRPADAAPRPAGGRPEVAAPAADPDAERAALAAFAEGTARAEADAAPLGPRRRPGQHLGPAAGRHRNTEPDGSTEADPGAERDQMMAYLEGLARAAGDPDRQTEPWSNA